MGAVDISRTNRVVAIDTPVFIYFLEDHAEYSAAAEHILVDLPGDDDQLLTSVLTIAEVATGPYRDEKPSLAIAHAARIRMIGNLQVRDVDSDIAQAAARIRARYGVRLPDAIHLATAVQSDADVFITNDRRLQQFTELRVRLLSDFVH